MTCCFWVTKERAELQASIVLLFHQPRFFEAEWLRNAAEKAFGIPFTDGDDAKNFVTQDGNVTLLKVGAHILSLQAQFRRYEAAPEFANTLVPIEAQRKAWEQHTAWAAIDYVSGSAAGGTDVHQEHCLLAKLCAEVIDDNCTGVYIPLRQLVLPYNKSTKLVLQRLSEAKPFNLLGMGALT